MTGAGIMRRLAPDGRTGVPRPSRPPVRLAWGLAAAALVAVALATPGFLSRPSLIALANAASLVGCVAVGMSFVTLSGNLMSFSLGAVTSLSGVGFMALLPWGLLPALLLALALGTALSAAQGLLVGWLRANPVIVSMAALALILGFADQVLGSKVDAPDDASYLFLKGRLGGVPIAFLVFAATAWLGQAILSWTSFGHQLRLVGSNRRAGEAAAIRVTAVITMAYAMAGLFSAVGGILLAIRFNSGDMQMGVGLEYQAIAAVLVGGVTAEGGRGSVWGAFAGVVAIAAMNGVGLLWGLGIETQRLVVGVAVLGMVVLQGRERWRS